MGDQPQKVLQRRSTVPQNWFYPTTRRKGGPSPSERAGSMLGRWAVPGGLAPDLGVQRLDFSGVPPYRPGRSPCSDSRVRLGPIWAFALVRDSQSSARGNSESDVWLGRAHLRGDTARTARHALWVTLVPPPASVGKTLKGSTPKPIHREALRRLASATSRSKTRRLFAEAAFLIYYLPYTR
jgi:hypothetical protein